MTSDFNITRLRHWSPVPLRVIVGYGFIAHGYAKVVSGPDHFAATLQALGVPVPHVMAWATIGFEILGGAAALTLYAVSLIALPDLLKQARIVQSRTFETDVTFFCAAVGYLILTGLATLAFRLLERRFAIAR